MDSDTGSGRPLVPPTNYCMDQCLIFKICKSFEILLVKFDPLKLPKAPLSDD